MEIDNTELDRVLSEKINSKKRSYRWATTISIISFIAGVVWIGFSVFKVNSLNLQATQLRGDNAQAQTELGDLKVATSDARKELDKYNKCIDFLKYACDQSAAAQQNSNDVASTTSIADRGAITVQYFATGKQGEKVQSALKDLGFKLEAKAPVLDKSYTNAFTNCIWFGPKVKTEYVKLVAYTLIQAGFEIKDIRPLLNSSNRELLVQVGGRIAAVQMPVWTAEKIQAATHFTR